MSRVWRAYEALFRSALLRLGARRVDQGVCWLQRRARAGSPQSPTDLTRALARLHARLDREAFALQARRESLTRGRPSSGENARMTGEPGGGTPTPTVNPPRIDSGPPREETHRAVPRHFRCDAGLGGLSRWLRAAGYPAVWEPGIDDATLVRSAQKSGATILTTDSLMMERRLLRTGQIPALWLPPQLTISEQLALVFDGFGLRRLPARCMRCGGELERADKAAVWDRIPPRTRLWLDEYFVCRSCNRLFWHGTHWARIQRQLDALGAGAFPPSQRSL